MTRSHSIFQWRAADVLGRRQTRSHGPVARLMNATAVWIFVFCLPLNAFAQSQQEAQFENEIRPVLVEVCFSCHGANGKVSGGLKVDGRDALVLGGDTGPAIVPGKPDESLLIRAIQRHEDVSAMPPDKEQALTQSQVNAFTQWIADGALWPAASETFRSKSHWSLEPISNPPIPPVGNAGWVKTSVDAFVLARQEAEGVRPVAPADRIALIRRATFDLTGLPPDPADVQAFVLDPSEHAFETVVERLLRSPHYGERWGRHWLDVVRYADTAGETADYPVDLAWKYRNYVIDAFNQDKPYDQFLREQIAGDILAHAGPVERYAEQVIATGFLAISRRFGFDSENYHHLTIQDTIDTLGQSVLGLSLGCARCHDHKFDAISMRDYYGLYGIFDSTRYPFPGSEQKGKMRSMAALVPTQSATAKLRQFERRLATIGSHLQKHQQPVPSAVLRVLNDIDGDFELQAPAAGGSNGVLVSPWIYDGPVSVTNDAQSPFKNVFLGGKVGTTIEENSTAYHFSQSIDASFPSKGQQLFFNCDFRVDPKTPNAKTMRHRLSLGAADAQPWLELYIGADGVYATSEVGAEPLAKLQPAVWYNLQVSADGDRPQLFQCRLSSAESTVDFGLPALPTATINPITRMLLKFASPVTASPAAQGNYPSIRIDNLAVQSEPFSPATISLPIDPEMVEPSEVQGLESELQSLVGLGGDFELHSDNQPPMTPWGAGPNSVVKVSGTAQSPLTNFSGEDKLGIEMPNRADYDGFGVTLPRKWLRETTPLVHAAFEFCSFDSRVRGDGTWRFYLGQGPGQSAAIELFFNANGLFARFGDHRERLVDLEPGRWYRIELKLDLAMNSYTGVLLPSAGGPPIKPFGGPVASGWNGTVDYSFIDSYGHIPGVRPGLRVDNYFIDEAAPLPLEQALAPAKVQSRLEALAKSRQLQERLALARQRLTVVSTEANQMLESGPFDLAYAVAEGTPQDARIQNRGEPSNRGDIVPRGFIQAVGGQSIEDRRAGSGRLELARWITSDSNPLTARVMANRIWHFHFGRGLVRTPNDFGVRGAPPTHPELLDHLATQFKANGYSMRFMHRLIMLSATYQQAVVGSDVANIERDQRLYVGFQRRRLSAEEIRDSILFVSGELDVQPGHGHEFPSWVTGPSYSQHVPFRAVYEHKKRSIYLMTQRIKRHPFLALFDGPDPNASTPARLGTTVPTQALFFLNDPFLHQTTAAWADRLSAREPSIEAGFKQAFLKTMSREPRPDELADAMEFANRYRAELTASGGDRPDQQTTAAMLRMLLSSNEFLHVD